MKTMYRFKHLISNNVQRSRESVLIEGSFEHPHSSASQIKEAVAAALTEWYKTPTGLKAWTSAHKRFSIAYLASYEEDPDLIELLKQQGLRDLNVTPSYVEHDWNYTEALGQAPENQVLVPLEYWRVLDLIVPYGIIPYQIIDRLNADLEPGQRPYIQTQVDEEVHYLLMAGLISARSLISSSDAGFLQPSVVWEEVLSEEEQRQWLQPENYSARPEINHPISLLGVTKDKYAWQARNWHPFKFAVANEDNEEGCKDAMIVSGLRQGSEFTIESTRKLVETSLAEWINTAEGQKYLADYEQDFCISDLAAIELYYRFDLDRLLLKNGLKNLVYQELISSPDWTYCRPLINKKLG